MRDCLYPGAKVVFVGGGTAIMRYTHGWRRFVPGFRDVLLTHNLVVGETYTVEAIRTHVNNLTGQEVVCAFLRGFRFREHGGIAFPATWFRPLQKRKTSIEIFKRMLTDAPNQKERLDA